MMHRLQACLGGAELHLDNEGDTEEGRQRRPRVHQRLQLSVQASSIGPQARVQRDDRVDAGRLVVSSNALQGHICQSLLESFSQHLKQQWGRMVLYQAADLHIGLHKRRAGKRPVHQVFVRQRDCQLFDWGGRSPRRTASPHRVYGSGCGVVVDVGRIGQSCISQRDDQDGGPF